MPTNHNYSIAYVPRFCKVFLRPVGRFRPCK
nr:MAG TPA: hypothetical protein [Caudoviricetes sp.]